MRTETLIEEIALVAEAGDASDALDLVRRLDRGGDVGIAIKVRRTVAGETLDRSALRAVARGIERMVAEHAAIFSPKVLESLHAMDAALRESARRHAETSPAVRRAQSAAAWTANQRRAELVTDYNAKVEYVNRQRGRAANERKAAAVRAKTCGGCFEVPAVNGACGC